MIANMELAAWLADPAAQTASMAATDAFTRRVAGHQLVTELRDELRALAPKTEAAVLALAHRFMSRVAAIDELLGSVIAAAARDPFFRPPLQHHVSEVSAGLGLFDDPSLWIAASVTRVDAIAAWKLARSGPASITFPGFLSILSFVKSGGATLSFWEAPEPREDFSVDNSGRCRFLGRRAVKDGDVVVIDGRRESFVFEHAEADIVHLQAQVRVDPAPLAVEYDAETMAFVGASATDEASSRIEMMITLLRLLDRVDAAPLIEKALASRDFHTRWHVMREYLALDAQAALPSLTRMAAQDPHPDVRAAARRTLDAFFSPDAPAGAITCHA